MKQQGARPHTVVAIIALYNGAEFIERSIRTVLAQTRQPDEFIVVDDGSTDDGPAIVERLAVEFPSIRLLHKENGGQSSARNHAIANSTSSLIALLDQDDGWYPDHLEELAKPFEEEDHFKLGWVYSNLDECDRFGRMRNRRMLSLMRQEHPKTRLEKCLADDMFILPSASLILREAFESVGGFDERLSGYEDDDLFVRLFRAAWNNVFIDKALSYWCIYTGSTSYSPRMARSRMIYFEKLYEDFDNSDMPAQTQWKDVIVHRFYMIVLSEMHRASLLGDEALYENSVRDIERIIPFLPAHSKRKAKLRMAVMRSYPRARFLRRVGAFKLMRTGRNLMLRRG
ncbi:glycosyltransferase [Aureimonas sp. ME7]|uniref:glycosyltransferase family 2 protein n=1 Tax=Aureimonas sp. ME7 TaxID=2744252 RepID=UPI001FCEE8FF|nr:glycosyltransferase [Aureimonas sp. ME7]